MEEEGITESKEIELVKLAQTFLISDGNIQHLSNIREVFEEDKTYAQVFNERRLKADSRHIVLCYKVQFKLKKLINDIQDKGYNKYAYAPKARNLLWALLCQGILNDNKLPDNSEAFGRKMNIPADFTGYLSGLATTRCRILLSELTRNEKYADKFKDGNFSFMRSKNAYDFCMEVAYGKWGWVEKKLIK